MTFESLLLYFAVTGASPVTIQQGVASTPATSPPPGPPPYPPPPPLPLPPPPRIAASPPAETAAQVPTATKPGTCKPGATREKDAKGENLVSLVYAMFEVTIRFCNVCR